MILPTRVLVLIAALLSLAPHARAQHERGPTQQAMRVIFSQLQIALPLAVDTQAFRDPKQAPRIREALQKLADAAHGLDEHGEGFDPGGLFLARSLERDARRALDHFRDGKYDSAEFFIGQLSESCIGCHSRLPSPGDAPLARGFAARADVTHLDPLERARLDVATRQFGDAASTLEAVLASPDIPPFEMLGPVTDYLTICVRVLEEPERPVPVLQRFARREDLWAALRGDVDAWIRYLPELSKREMAGDPVEQAEKLIAEGRHLILFPSDRRALVHYLFASKRLHGYVAKNREPSPTLARAYYLLGLAESRIGPNFWISQAEFYLETAVRMAPGSEVGRDAYALLEEETLAGYTGSGGLQLPEDVDAHLRELRELIRAGKPRSL
jgi:hypothetical protein